MDPASLQNRTAELIIKRVKQKYDQKHGKSFKKTTNMLKIMKKHYKIVKISDLQKVFFSFSQIG